MPQCTAIVDELRATFGAQCIDQAMRRAQRGWGVCYLAELTPDGQVLDWGRQAPGKPRATPADFTQGAACEST